jgi:hypothetical protein
MTINVMLRIAFIFCLVLIDDFLFTEIAGSLDSCCGVAISLLK